MKDTLKNIVFVNINFSMRIFLEGLIILSATRIPPGRSRAQWKPEASVCQQLLGPHLGTLDIACKWHIMGCFGCFQGPFSGFWAPFWCLFCSC